MIIYKKPIDKYTMVSNAFLQDESISAEAKIVAVVLMSYPTKWEVNITHLSKTIGKGVATIRKALKELVEIGKLEITKNRDEAGKFEGKNSYIFKGEYEEQRVAKIEEQEIESLENESEIKHKLSDENDDKNAANAENKAFYPRVHFTACGEMNHIINNNIYKKEIYLTRAKAKTILADHKELFGKAYKPNTSELNLEFLTPSEAQSFYDFISYRKERDSKAITITTQRYILKRLQTLKDEGHSVIAVVAQSIERGYTGLFPPRATLTTNYPSGQEYFATEVIDDKAAREKAYALEYCRKQRDIRAEKAAQGLKVTLPECRLTDRKQTKRDESETELTPEQKDKWSFYANGGKEPKRLLSEAEFQRALEARIIADELENANAKPYKPKHTPSLNNHALDFSDSKGLTKESHKLHLELLEAFKRGYPKERFEYLKEERVLFIEHKTLGAVFAVKRNGYLQLCSEAKGL